MTIRNPLFDGIPYPRFDQIPAALALPRRFRPVRNVELADGTQLVPFPGGVFGSRVAGVVAEAKAATRGSRDQVAGAQLAVPRLSDDAHGGGGEGRGGRQAGADEALEGGPRSAGGGGQVNVQVRDKGCGGVGDEEDRRDAAQRNFGGLLDGLVGLDVAGNGDATEEDADKERRHLEHGEKGGPSRAGVVDEQALRDF